ncbi:BREX system Lon protease-like protein BrxL [Hymenobacter sp. 5414T-23]|uniref:BREX system Lon protease-like protein BrxL n=1 Tax=Hymenobacter sp. 5414T-23 TaxID=2932252 RepID=UPI001FD14892|nr:BREX system Lon protease-like protein BrxL [Hymenobacter sp. 5414T-23]UOQ83259.1 BREX system Lon protease-like protein BrxL [Hymenobacter sp. 5414T-23]
MVSINQLLNTHFAGKVVRKDLTKLVKGNAIVPTYVLEYLLGQYCATDVEDTIAEGVENVRNIIAQHFVHRDEAQMIKSTIREKGSHRIIDKVSVRLNDRKDVYEADFANLGLNKVVIDDQIVKEHKKLLSSGVWCIVTMGYMPSDERDVSPWVIDNLKPIQIANIDVTDYKETRERFTKEEWIDALMQSIGLNPVEFSFRSKLLQLSRLIPFAENNYNLVELGPKGTGKSHIYSEMSPHAILISGGEVSKAKLFVNNTTGDIGLVGYWDVVAYDEFAGKDKRADRGLVDILKNYMANKSFSRGTQVYGAAASMVFVGNTDHSVPYMLKHSNLFEALPKDYYDTAFLDRVHAYLPGWEVQKLRNEMFTTAYGFIVDYLAEVLKELRKEDYTQAYTSYFRLSDTITTRDKDAIAKTFSGLVKLIYPHGQFTENEAKELLDFAIENRKRVKQQLIKMDETFEEVDFSYTQLSNGQVVSIETLEVLEFGPNRSEPAAFTAPVDSSDSSPKPSNEAGIPPAAPGQRILRDNQTNVTFADLFAPYLVGATKVVVTDPYIRLPYQLRNFMEFARLLAASLPAGEEISLHLATFNNEDYLANSREALKEIGDSLEGSGIQFTFEFDETIHDRAIECNNGWKIVLGRGLDIYQKTNGRFDLAEYMQEKRLCKACEITYLQI